MISIVFAEYENKIRAGISYTEREKTKVPLCESGSSAGAAPVE